MECCQIIKGVLNSIFVYPWTAGNLQNDNHNLKSDGSLSAVVLNVFLLSSMLVVVGFFGNGVFCSNYSLMRNTLLSNGLIIVASIFLILLSVQAHQERTNRRVENGTSRMRGAKKMILIFLWMLGIAKIICAGIYLAASIECLSQYGHINIRCQVESIFSEIIILVFISFQMGFLSYFIDYKFRGSIRTNYGFLFILLANCITWFGKIVDSIHDFYLSVHDEGGIDFCKLNQTMHPLPTATYRCNNSSPFHKFIDYVTPNIEPIRTEYFLLSSALILSLWPPMKRRVHKGQKTDTTDKTNPTTQCTNELSPLLEGDASSYSINSSVAAEIQNLERTRASSVIFIRIILISLSMIPLIAGRVVYVYITTKQNPSHSLMITSCYKFIMSMASFYLMYNLRKTRPQHVVQRPIKIRDAILILSAAGLVMMCTVCVIAGININPIHLNQVSEGKWLVVDNVINIVHCYLQTTLILQAQRTQLTENQTRLLSARSLYLMLAFLNFTFWLNDSIFDIRVYHTSIIPGCYFKEVWIIVLLTVFPVLMFYRIYSSIFLYDIYSKYKTDHTIYSS